MPAVLEGLETNEAALDELQVASELEFARYPVVYDLENPWGIFLPHLINVRDACRRLQLRACADLAAGRSNGPMEDVKLMLYLANSVKGEPFLISHLVRLACAACHTGYLGGARRAHLVRRPVAGNPGHNGGAGISCPR